MLGDGDFYIKFLEIMIPLKPTHQSKDKKKAGLKIQMCKVREDGEKEDRVKRKVENARKRV